MSASRFWQTPEFLAGASSGLLLTLAAPPSPLGFLGYFALAPLLLVFFHPRRLREATPLRWRVLVISFGLSHHLSELHWLLMLDDAASMKFRWLVLPAGLFLLAVYMTLWDGLAFWVCARLRRRFEQQAIWWFPMVWVCVEYLRGAGEVGFPWLRLGMTQLDYVPLLQIAGIFGELGVSFLVATINVLVAVTWLSLRGEFPALGHAVLFRWWAPVTALLLLGGVALYGVPVSRELEDSADRGEGLSVGVIQGNVALADKFDPARRDSTFVPYTLLSERAAAEGARLVVWPETAVPMDLLRAPRYLEWVQEMVSNQGIYLLTGYPERQVTEDGSLRRYNSSLLMDDAGAVRARYRKIHLVPFGERMPFQSLLPFLGKLDFGQAEWDVGPERTIFEVDGHRFGNLICFESIYSKPSREAVRKGAGFLVNMSNDGWFGNTLGPYQHGLMAAMRSAENRVPTVRCSNNGICFYVLPSGRVVQETPLLVRTHILRAIHPNPGGSPYTRWGELPLGLLMLFQGITLVYLGRRPR